MKVQFSLKYNQDRYKLKILPNGKKTIDKIFKMVFSIQYKTATF